MIQTYMIKEETINANLRTLVSSEMGGKGTDWSSHLVFYSNNNVLFSNCGGNVG